MNKYETILKFNLHKNKVEPGSNRLNYGQSSIEITAPIPPGIYSAGGWAYEDTGNISVNFQRVTQSNEGVTPMDEGLADDDFS